MVYCKYKERKGGSRGWTTGLVMEDKNVLDMMVTIQLTDGRDIHDFVQYAMHEFEDLVKKEGSITVEDVETHYI